MDDRERLWGYVELWWQAIGDVAALGDRLEPDHWRLPTDLPGWDVHAVAAHIAHLEASLAGAPEDRAPFEPPPHVRNPMGLYTERGVAARREASPGELIAEIRRSAEARRAQLLADPPTDGTAPPARTLGALDWDTETLLRNRPLDVWMHEQDIRRAVGRPGNLDGPAARHTISVFLGALGPVFARGVGAPPGTSLLVEVDGAEPVAVAVDDTGRGRRLAEPPASATVTVRTDRESFVVLAGGRRTPPEGAVRVEGDVDLGRRVLAALAVTP